MIYQYVLVPNAVYSALWTKHICSLWFEVHFAGYCDLNVPSLALHSYLSNETRLYLAWCEYVGLRIGLSVGRLAAPITERSRVQTLAAVSRGGERDNAHEGQESGLSSVFILSQATERRRRMLE